MKTKQTKGSRIIQRVRKRMAGYSDTKRKILHDMTMLAMDSRKKGPIKPGNKKYGSVLEMMENDGTPKAVIARFKSLCKKFKNEPPPRAGD